MIIKTKNFMKLHINKKWVHEVSKARHQWFSGRRKVAEAGQDLIVSDWSTPWAGRKPTGTRQHSTMPAAAPASQIHTQTHTSHRLFYRLSFSYFNGHFRGGPKLAGTRMSAFWILLELRITEVVVTTEAIWCAKLQSKCHHQQTNI